jgi:hypothetical protein
MGVVGVATVGDVAVVPPPAHAVAQRNCAATRAHNGLVVTALTEDTAARESPQRGEKRRGDQDKAKAPPDAVDFHLCTSTPL